MFTRAIVRPPAPNFSEGLTTSRFGAPTYQVALNQHAAYCAALEQCGLTLTRLTADPDYPDATFVEDTAIVLRKLEPSLTVGLVPRIHPSAFNDRCAVLARPGALSRQGEVQSTRTALADLFPSLSEIQAPGTLDGGDVCEAEKHFFIGISERTNESGTHQLAELLQTNGYSSTFIDIRNAEGLLHLKSGLAYLGDKRLVVTESLARCAEFDGYELIQIDSGEEYAANCIRVNDHILLAAGYPRFESKLRDLGYQTIALEMSEFEKMDGGLSCLSVRF